MLDPVPDPWRQNDHTDPPGQMLPKLLSGLGSPLQRQQRVLLPLTFSLLGRQFLGPYAQTSIPGAGEEGWTDRQTAPVSAHVLIINTGDLSQPHRRWDCSCEGPLRKLNRVFCLAYQSYL